MTSIESISSSFTYRKQLKERRMKYKKEMTSRMMSGREKNESSLAYVPSEHDIMLFDDLSSLLQPSIETFSMNIPNKKMKYYDS